MGIKSDDQVRQKCVDLHKMAAKFILLGHIKSENKNLKT